MITSNKLATDILQKLGIDTKRTTAVHLQLKAGEPAILWVAHYMPYDFCIEETLDKYEIIAKPLESAEREPNIAVGNFDGVKNEAE